MLRILTLSLILFAGTCLGQSSKKILGKWISGEKIELLNRFDTLTFVKEDESVKNKYIEKNCHYTQWDFTKGEDPQKLLIYIYKGCKGAGVVNTSVTNDGSWSIDKKNVLTIFDDKFTKHVFEVTFLENEFKLKRIK